MGDTKKKKKTTKKQRAKRRKVMFIVEIVILLILLAAVFVWLKLEKIDYNNLDEDDILSLIHICHRFEIYERRSVQ